MYDGWWVGREVYGTALGMLRTLLAQGAEGSNPSPTATFSMVRKYE